MDAANVTKPARAATTQQPGAAMQMNTMSVPADSHQHKAARIRGGGAGRECFMGLVEAFICFECCKGCCECFADIICCPCEMCC